MADASGNNANYNTAPWVLPLDSGTYYTTVVGEFQNSESPYGTFDQAANLWEWNEALIPGIPFDFNRGMRGGHYSETVQFLRASYRYSVYPSNENSAQGFRVAAVAEQEQAPVPAVSEWGMVTMALLVLTAGTLVWARRRTAIA